MPFDPTIDERESEWVFAIEDAIAHLVLAADHVNHASASIGYEYGCQELADDAEDCIERILALRETLVTRLEENEA